MRHELYRSLYHPFILFLRIDRGAEEECDFAACGRSNLAGGKSTDGRVADGAHSSARRRSARNSLRPLRTPGIFSGSADLPATGFGRGNRVGRFYATLAKRAAVPSHAWAARTLALHRGAKSRSGFSPPEA